MFYIELDKGNSRLRCFDYVDKGVYNKHKIQTNFLLYGNTEYNRDDMNTYNLAWF